MKKILLFTIGLIFAMAAHSCVASGAENNKVENTEVSSKLAVKHLTKAEFLEKVYNYEKNPDKWVYEGDTPAIVDFYATWCGPCKTLSPILDQLVKEYDGKIIIYKIDTDKERELAAAFGIRSIPSLLFIPESGQPQMAQGALPKQELKKVIDEFLLGKTSAK